MQGFGGSADATATGLVHRAEGAVVAWGGVRLGRMRAGAARADVVGARIAVVRARAHPGREDAAAGGIAGVDGALSPIIADERAARLASGRGVADVADRARVVVVARGPGCGRVRLAAPDRIAG